MFSKHEIFINKRERTEAHISSMRVGRSKHSMCGHTNFWTQLILRVYVYEEWCFTQFIRLADENIWGDTVKSYTLGGHALISTYI